MARFGLLALNKGVWDNEVILDDANYFLNMVNSSQKFNEAYGYLWWLNGKSSLIIPGLSIQLDRSLVPNGPEDLIAGLGKNGQFLDVVPSKNMVVIRIGEDPDNSLVPINFHNEMWVYLNDILF
jgi:CubicO group peptidase (beta-lactamase class C family)